MQQQALDAATTAEAKQSELESQLEEARKQLEDQSGAARQAEAALVRMQMTYESDIQALHQSLQVRERLVLAEMQPCEMG